MIKNKKGKMLATFGQGCESFFIFVKHSNSSTGYNPQVFVDKYSKELSIKTKLYIRLRSFF